MKKITLLFLFVNISYFLNAQLLTENFDDITQLSNWDIINVSSPVGIETWRQGSGGYGPQSGVSTSYISANSSCTSGTGTISTWLILPSLSLKDGDKINFYTRSDFQANYPDRLQVRLSTIGINSTAPINETDLGDYTMLLEEINPSLTLNTYPETYTEYEVTVTGIGSVAMDARIAFRYFVTDAGPTGGNSYAIAIDSLTVTQETLSLNNLNVNDIFKHFYNKNTKTLTLKSPDLKFEKIDLYNVIGQNVLSRNLNNSTENINMEHLKDGLYIFKASIGDMVKTIKFLKQ